MANGNSVGQINLDLAVNKKQFDKQLSGISKTAQTTGANLEKQFSGMTNTFKKVGVAVAAAFSVKKIVDFGKQCIDLGSDLAEVQNVVDVTFPNMTAQVDKFAQSAATSFGLSETMAKKYTGTFGAMAKAFGFTESQAYDMGSTLTGLAGDVASFYNITQDEAYTKLKSVFTGETESLKDLGVVMTQTALDSYAMANGFGKTTAKMSEAEKVALRYSFVQNQLSAASGDFARTSDGWANQVRILNLQFDSLKATIGQGLINVFTPVLKVINTVIGKLAVLANSFKSFTEMLTGKKSAGSQMASAGAEAEKSLSNAAGAADGLSDSTAGAGKVAKKAAKDMKALMGFDQIQKIDGPGDSSSEDSDGSTSVGGMDFGSLATGGTVIDKVDGSCSQLMDRIKELASLCAKGFSIGFGDSEKNIKTIHKSVKSIGKSLKDIFTSPEVKKASKDWADAVALNFGKVTGSVMGIGVSLVTNLTSGISKSLDEKKGFIKEKIASLFEINASVWKLNGDYAAALGDIIGKAFASDAAVNISSDIFSILTTGVLGGAELFARAGYDLSSCIIQPIINNKDKISEAITNTLEPISTVVDTVKTGVEDAFSVIKQAYDEHIAPTFTAFKEGISDSFGKLLDAYNEHIAPVLDTLAEKFQTVYKEHLKPCMEKIGGLFGKVSDAVRTFYEEWLKPLIDWCIENIIPVLAPIFENIGKTIMDVFGAIGDVVGGLVDILGGIIDFIVGVFTGDWEKAWNGVKSIFSGIFNALVGIIKVPINGIIRGLNTLIGGLNKIKFDIPDWVLGIGGKSFGINIPKIPELAQGGYAKPNTPQLAMIGDNRHQGEVVAPEDKLREMAVQAAQMAGTGNGITREELERIINNAVLRIVSALYELGFNLDGEQMAKAEKVVKQSMDRRFNTVSVV